MLKIGVGGVHPRSIHGLLTQL